MPTLFDSHAEFNEWFSKDIESHAEKKSGLDESNGLLFIGIEQLICVLFSMVWGDSVCSCSLLSISVSFLARQ